LKLFSEPKHWKHIRPFSGLYLAVGMTRKPGYVAFSNLPSVSPFIADSSLVGYAINAAEKGRGVFEVCANIFKRFTSFGAAAEAAFLGFTLAVRDRRERFHKPTQTCGITGDGKTDIRLPASDGSGQGLFQPQDTAGFINFDGLLHYGHRASITQKDSFVKSKTLTAGKS
jgi:hypothetical protein